MLSENQKSNICTNLHGKIVILSYEVIHNAGESILGDTTEYLVRKIGIGQEIIRGQVWPKLSRFDFRRLYGLMCRLGAKVGGRLGRRLMELYQTRNEKRMELYYERILDNASYVILAVGAMNYSVIGFDWPFDIITRIADAKGIHVMLNATHVTEPNSSDKRFDRMKMAINRNCVKMITTRDGLSGIRNLRENWIVRHDIALEHVGDAALWIPEAYQQRKIVGIGLIRNGIFTEYGFNISDETLLDIYCDLIHEVESLGYRWELFSNGMRKDWEFGLALVNRLGIRRQDVKVAKDGNGVELVRIISGYDAVIAGRLHAMLTAAALGKPFVGYVWDSKIWNVFAAMGMENNLIGATEISGKSLAVRLDKILTAQSVVTAQYKILKQKTLDSIQKFLCEQWSKRNDATS